MVKGWKEDNYGAVGRKEGGRNKGGRKRACREEELGITRRKRG